MKLEMVALLAFLTFRYIPLLTVYLFSVSGTYFCLNMILITTSTFLNVLVVNLSFYGARAPVPKLMKKVCALYLIVLLF